MCMWYTTHEEAEQVCRLRRQELGIPGTGWLVTLVYQQVVGSGKDCLKNISEDQSKIADTNSEPLHGLTSMCTHHTCKPHVHILKILHLCSSQRHTLQYFGVYFMSMNVLPDSMYLYHMYTVSMEARKGCQFSKTVVIEIVSHHTGTENQTQVLWKGSKCS